MWKIHKSGVLGSEVTLDRVMNIIVIFIDRTKVTHRFFVDASMTYLAPLLRSHHCCHLPFALWCSVRRLLLFPLQWKRLKSWISAKLGVKPTGKWRIVGFGHFFEFLLCVRYRFDKNHFILSWPLLKHLLIPDCLPSTVLCACGYAALN